MILSSANNLLQIYDPGRMPRVYVHLPFCKYKCAYCGFYSIASGLNTKDIENKYFSRLFQEIDLLKKYFKDIPLSVYIGGGTPNLPQIFDRTIEVLKSFKGCAEVTVECNLEFLNEHQLSLLFKNATRLSVGVQSLSEIELNYISRFSSNTQEHLYSFLEYRKNVKNPPVVNLDFINCITHYDYFTKYIINLFEICKKRSYKLPEHISVYSLSIDEGTFFEKQVKNKIKIALNDELSVTQMLSAWNVLKKYGYEHYEVSAFARDGYQCSHNLNYWALGEYIGLGAGAAGRCFSKKGSFEISYKSDVLDYCSKPAFTGYEITSLTQDDIALELILTGLRTKKGLNLEDFKNRVGFDIKPLCQKAGLIIEGVYAKIFNDSSITEQNLTVAQKYIERLAQEYFKAKRE